MINECRAMSCELQRFSQSFPLIRPALYCSHYNTKHPITLSLYCSHYYIKHPITLSLYCSHYNTKHPITLSLYCSHYYIKHPITLFFHFSCYKTKHPIALFSYVHTASFHNILVFNDFISVSNIPLNRRSAYRSVCDMSPEGAVRDRLIEVRKQQEDD